MRNVTNKTTIIILGDARGNRTDPRTDIMAAAVAAGEADHLAEPGIPVRVGHRRFGHVPLLRRSATW